MGEKKHEYTEWQADEAVKEEAYWKSLGSSPQEQSSSKSEMSEEQQIDLLRSEPTPKAVELAVRLAKGHLTIKQEGVLFAVFVEEKGKDQQWHFGRYEVDEPGAEPFPYLFDDENMQKQLRAMMEKKADEPSQPETSTDYVPGSYDREKGTYV